MMKPDPGPSPRWRRHGAIAPEREAEAAARAWSEADRRQALYRAALLAVALAAAALPFAVLLR
jgi:hypothetical protein